MMHGRYEVDDLLKLRASPLCGRPPSLPPKEEWMGPGDLKPRVPSGRVKPEDTLNQPEGFSKRPSLLDSARRSTTDPDRLHFGPPRNSFASSNPARTRNGTHERTKTNEDESTQTDRKLAGFGGVNSKFNTRTDDELVISERPRRRNHDDSDAEVRPRRDFDRPRWGGRDGQSDPPWAKRDRNTDVEDKDSPIWRRGGRDREYDRVDPEPEWVDSTDPAETGKAHTHDDFVEWMEKMKNNKKSVDSPSLVAQPAPLQPAVVLSEKPTSRVLSDSSASVDRFFAKFEEQKSPIDVQTAARPAKSRFASIFGSKDEPKPDPIPAAPASIPIATVSQPQAVELEYPEPPIKEEKKANDEAFAKLLQMLSKNQAGSATGPKTTPQTRGPVNIAELTAARSPDVRPASSSANPINRTPVLSHNSHLSIDRLIESRSPAQHPHHDQTGQFKATPQDLLDLLRRSNLQDVNRQPTNPLSYVPNPPQESRMPPPPPGLAGYPNRDFDRQVPPLISTRREGPRSIFDDPAFMKYKPEPTYQQRAPQPPEDANPHGGLAALFGNYGDRNQDFRERYVPNGREELRLPVNPPPGLQRPPPPPPPPPGLDNAPRGQPRPPPGTGWPTNPLPPPRGNMHQYGADQQQPQFIQNQDMYRQPQLLHGPQQKQMPHELPRGIRENQQPYYQW